MEDSIKEAIWLLFVGMGSVFFIFYLIGESANFLIRWVNSLSFDKSQALKNTNTLHNGIHPERIAIMAAVIDKVTAGKGKIESIQKIEL